MCASSVSVFDLLTNCVCLVNIASHDDIRQARSGGLGALKLLGRVIEILTSDVVDLELFDGLVCDRACQIRALYVATVLRNAQFPLEAIREQAQALALRIASVKGPFLQRKFKPLLQEIGDLPIPVELFHLAQCFLLYEIKSLEPKAIHCHHCNTKVDGIGEETSYKNGHRYFDLSKSKVKTIVDATRVQLCHASISHLRTMCDVASDAYTHHMLSDQALRVILGRPELPCYYTLKGMLDVARHLTIGLLLKVRFVEHTVEPVSNKAFDLYVPVIQLDPDENAPLIVIEAIKLMPEAYYAERLAQHNLFELFEMNAACHAQYSDNEPMEAQAMARLEPLIRAGHDRGCCRENMKLLCITHIFCDTLASQRRKHARTGS